MSPSPTGSRSRLRPAVVAVVALLIVGLLTAGVVATDTLGSARAFGWITNGIGQLLDAGSGDPIPAVVIADPGTSASPSSSPPPSASPAPSPTPLPSPSPSPSPPPSPSPSPSPVRAPVDVRLDLDPDRVFASQATKKWCAVAGTQIVLAALGLADDSEAFQRRIAARIGEWESLEDSRNGGWGPTAIARALEAYGAPGYEVRAYRHRADAMRDFAVAIETTGMPVVLIAWFGAHTWVMTGYQADADPLLFADADVHSAYIYDPWYPRVSSIWGRSDGPGVLQDRAEMERNYKRWIRPEGKYPDRDYLFLAVVPTRPVGDAPLPLIGG